MKDISGFQRKYRYGAVLGEGNFSVVRECIMNDNSQYNLAVKIVRLKGNKEKKDDIRKMMQREVQVMKKIDNMNIIKFIDAFFGNEEILVVLEGTKVCTVYLCILMVAEHCSFSFNASIIHTDVARSYDAYELSIYKNINQISVLLYAVHIMCYLSYRLF